MQKVEHVEQEISLHGVEQCDELAVDGKPVCVDEHRFDVEEVPEIAEELEGDDGFAERFEIVEEEACGVLRGVGGPVLAEPEMWAVLEAFFETCEGGLVGWDVEVEVAVAYPPSTCY